MYADVMIFGQYDFCFDGVRYGNGTVVMIWPDKIDKFDWCTNLVFKGYNYNNDHLYHFGSLYDKWIDYCMTQDELNLYIKKIIKACYSMGPQDIFEKVHFSNIDGIVATSTWYILVMAFAIFVKGISGTIIIWTAASYIFWTWLTNKINGG